VTARERPAVPIPDTAADDPEVQAALSRFATLFPKLIDLSLDRMRRLLADLGDPQDRLPPVIHVAGTNGKGSTVAMMRAVLEAAGHRVHAYTSPHLVRFAERIRLSGAIVDEALLAELLAHVERVNAGRPITFFEMTTAVAFKAFAEIPADAVLLETGLGGTFDATNVVERPLTTVLTSISMDHMQHLGDTLAKIAQEKANIMKPGVPCVSVRQHVDAATVIAATAARVGCDLLIQDRDWSIAADDRGGLTFRGTAVEWKTPLPNLPGRHQHQNAGAALAALEAAAQRSGLLVPAFAVRQGLRAIDWPARAQRLTQGPIVDTLPGAWETWLDGGHNEGGGAALADLIDEHWGDRPLHIVAGMLATKPARDFLNHLARRAASFTAVEIPGHPSAYAAGALADVARETGIGTVATASDTLAAVHALPRDGAPPSRVLICGSLYLAGEVLRRHA
jgi:dihydrofolate synthase/folylpolyglutamate synthase